MNTNAPEVHKRRPTTVISTLLASEINEANVDLVFTPPSETGSPATWHIPTDGTEVGFSLTRKISYNLKGEADWNYTNAWLIVPPSALGQSYYSYALTSGGLTIQNPSNSSESLASIVVNTFNGTLLQITVTNVNKSGSCTKLGLLLLVGKGDDTPSFLSPDPQIILPAQQNKLERIIPHLSQAAKR